MSSEIAVLKLVLYLLSLFRRLKKELQEINKPKATIAKGKKDIKLILL